MVRFLARAKDLPLLHTIQTDYGSYSMGTGDSLHGGKAAEAYHSPSSSAEVKNGGAIPSLLHTSSWSGALLIKHRDNITFFTFSILQMSG
jgi:hypothetical protein